MAEYKAANPTHISGVDELIDEMRRSLGKMLIIWLQWRPPARRHQFKSAGLYFLIGLIRFYTMNLEKLDVKVWLLRQGLSTPEAAAVVDTDTYRYIVTSSSVEKSDVSQFEEVAFFQ